MKKHVSYPPDLIKENDGFYIPDVGDWSEEKYRLLWLYANLFATSMKKKWHTRCYIDLFSGAGYARIQGTSRIIRSSSLLSLQVNDPFDYYIFCDSNPDCIAALENRAADLSPSAKCFFENCDANTSYARILSKLPVPSKDNRVLSFCLVDPFKLDDIKFRTIRELSGRFMDFLINIPAMDPRRNESIYSSDNSDVISEYLDEPSWRDIRRRGDPSIPFNIFVEKMLDNKMKSLGFNYGGFHMAKIVRSTQKNLLLYSLGFYRRHPRGEEFWKQALKYSDPQGNLFR